MKRTRIEQTLIDRMVQVMERAGTDPAIIYAFKKTGRIVSDANISQLSKAEIDEWNRAVEEYDDPAKKTE